MNIRKINEIESNIDRAGPERYSVALFKSGEWWRAYNTSAFLLYNYPGTENRLKPVKRHYKEINTGMVCVGLRPNSFDKYLPGLNLEEFINEDNTVIDLRSVYEDCVDIENYPEWYDGIEMTGMDDSNTDSYTKHPTKFSKIIDKIMSVQLDRTTPMECMTILSDVQVSLRNVLCRL